MRPGAASRLEASEAPGAEDPFGMTGARLTGHILQEGRRRRAKWGVITMCIGGGQGGASLFEIYS